jgi:hypothetical protein
VKWEGRAEEAGQTKQSKVDAEKAAKLQSLNDKSRAEEVENGTEEGRSKLKQRRADADEVGDFEEICKQLIALAPFLLGNGSCGIA